MDTKATNAYNRNHQNGGRPSRLLSENENPSANGGKLGKRCRKQQEPTALAGSNFKRLAKDETTEQGIDRTLRMSFGQNNQRIKIMKRNSKTRDQRRKFNALVRFFKLFKGTNGRPVPDMPEIPPPPPQKQKRAPTGNPGMMAFVPYETRVGMRLERIEKKLDQLIESNTRI
jgi:hypothetical protein